MLRRRSIFALLALACCLPGAAHAWWNDDWGARRPLRIDLSAAGANLTEPIGPAAVLIRLHAGNFKFDLAKEDGSDVRFLAADDKTPLPYHFERFDPLLGEALVWVGIPDLKPGDKNELFLYYKNPKAAPADDPKGTWDKDMAGVWHFGERGAPARDFTVWANHASSAGTAADGALIGRGLRFDGNSAITIPSGPSLSWAAGAAASLTVWIRPEAAEATGVILSRREGERSFVLGLDAGKPYLEVDAGAGPTRVSSSSVLAAASWHQLGVTSGQALTIWLDGVQSASAAGKMPALNSPLLVGGEGASAPKPDAAKAPAPKKAGAPAVAPAPLAPAGFKGDLDELQISKVERPAGYLPFVFASQGTDPGRLIAFGQDEESGGSSNAYFAVILRSVTPDGWVVIGLLMLMAVVSWMVMANKASYLSSVEKANEQFLAKFHAASVDLVKLVLHTNGVSPLGEAKVLGRASLYRLFVIAADEVRKRVLAKKNLSTHAIESIRSSLDAGLVREGQRLNRRMVLLTIAISGGPFLGLLGTVVGVMITFAAIAAAGDVNVNAIAPGIAAALVATVAGLAVAIPALFGYNWLLTRVKDTAANQQVFADELITRLAEAFADRRADETDADDVEIDVEIVDEKPKPKPPPPPAAALRGAR